MYTFTNLQKCFKTILNVFLHKQKKKKKKKNHT